MLSFLPLIPLIIFGVWLSWVDIKMHRLPNTLVGWFALIELCLLTALSLFVFDLNRLVSALATAAITMAIYLLLHLVSRGALGMGDVKFAFPLGLCIGWYSSEYMLSAIFISFLAAGLVALIGIISRQMTRQSRLAFGPYMFLGTILCIRLT